LPLLGKVHAAGTQDRYGVQAVLGPLGNRFTKLRKIWANSIYNGGIAEWVGALRQRNRIDLEIVKRPEGATGFQVITIRWVVERTFAWLSFHRRMSKDYEYLPETSEALIRIAMIRLMLARLT
jgi:putative transposase